MGLSLRIAPRLALLPLLLSLGSAVLANEQYDAGATFAREVQGSGEATMGSFVPSAALPSYTETPQEAGWYGGVEAPSTDMSGAGNQALQESEVGQAITESILNTPSDNKPSLDAPFISVGTEAQEGAESVTDGSFDGCTEQEVSQTEFTNHVCERDTNVDQYCERKATIGGSYDSRAAGSRANKEVVIDAWQTTYTPSLDGPLGAVMTASFPAPFKGTIVGLRAQILSCEGINCPFLYYGEAFRIAGQTLFASGWGESIAQSESGVELTGAYGVKVNQGDLIELAMSASYVFMCDSCDELAVMRAAAAERKAPIRLTFLINTRDFHPELVWNEVCPFDKAEGSLTSSQCTEPGEERTIYVDGEPYSLYSDCWAWRDTYLTQSASEGTCGPYLNDPACTVANRQCAYSQDGLCLHENLTYSCEHKTTGTGVVCGGEFFCTDGSCEQAEAGKSQAFEKAVSSLAAVAAAGKDVAAAGEMNVRAFTGKAMFCKKFAAGFSNCCVDSGWGQDMGLASCSSDEQALGEAKSRRLTVEVGEFCSKKVLGICVEKKRGYCVFDSKLAQILQQQGRQWQLGIGFGSADSPDCRGITVEELQDIKFNQIDFSAFYDDLKNGTTIPEDGALLERVQQQINDWASAHRGKKR